MSNDFNNEVQKFDNDESENRAFAKDALGFSDEQLAVADRDIAEVRESVASGDLTAYEAEDIVADNIDADLSSGDESGDDFVNQLLGDSDEL